MEIALLFALIILLIMTGVPVAICLGISSTFFLLVYSDSSLASIAQSMFSTFDSHYTLLAIPFFILASSFMSTGGVAKRIIRFAIACVGSVHGGLAIASVFACMMFAALSGSSPATVVAIGSIVIAGMREVGYSKEFATGVICNAGTLGILIPPSIVMVVYAAATDVSVGRMFLAGVLPGLIAGLMLMIAIYIFARIKKMPRQPFKGFREILSAGKDAFSGLMLIIIILGGIYGGIFTPTEAAAVAAVYAFLIANFVYRDMGPFKNAVGESALGESGLKAANFSSIIFRAFSAFWHEDTRKTLTEAAKLSFMLLFIIANALILKHVLTEEQIPQSIAASILGVGLTPVMFLLLLNIVLLIGGQFIDPASLLIIVAPLVFPIAIELGIDPIHLGIIMVVNMEIAMITPPVGLNLFVAAGISQMPVLSVVRASLPWLMVLVAFLILVTYVPFISTVIPTYFMGPELIIK